MTLATGLDYADLHFLGTPEVIATAILHGREGAALVDPGPSTTLPALRAALSARGFAMADVRAILLTHIHLDHAGAAGSLAAECPHAVVYVHERGAPHLIDPAKLLSSATRLYGADMERLWGEVRPIPEERVRVLVGRSGLGSAEPAARLSIVGHDLEWAYTPGHASHHVSYFHAASGIAFVGDTAGIPSERPDCAAGHTAAGHRPGSLAREHQPDPRVAPGSDLPHALRTPARAAGALQRSLDAHGRLEPARPRVDQPIRLR
jgi:glyoxylase-like metal-dependent hydrolase (beta-lactamase superfamily II)